MRSAPDEGGSAPHLGVKHQIKSEAISAKSEKNNDKLKNHKGCVRSALSYGYKR
jgi:hypothetical protein